MDPYVLRDRAAALHVLPRQNDDYRGGWPLGYIGPQCPADAPVVCKRDSDEEPQGCCPQGQFCFTTISEVYCCPTEANCGTAVANRPVCANPAWTLFGLTSNRYFCCPSRYFGVKSVELSGRGICELSHDGLPATRLASTISSGTPAATGTGIGRSSRQTTSPGGSTGSTGTSDSSTTKNGGGGSISAGVIAGSVVGGVVLLLSGIALVLWLHRRSLRRNPGLGPGPGPEPTPETKFEPPPQPSPSPGMVNQNQYQHPPPPQPQHSSPATATPPPQYGYPQPPEADSLGRFEMPVHAHELPHSTTSPMGR